MKRFDRFQFYDKTVFYNQISMKCPGFIPVITDRKYFFSFEANFRFV